MIVFQQTNVIGLKWRSTGSYLELTPQPQCKARHTNGATNSLLIYVSLAVTAWCRSFFENNNFPDINSKEHLHTNNNKTKSCASTIKICTTNRSNIDEQSIHPVGTISYPFETNFLNFWVMGHIVTLLNIMRLVREECEREFQRVSSHKTYDKILVSRV